MSLFGISKTPKKEATKKPAPANQGSQLKDAEKKVEPKTIAESAAKPEIKTGFGSDVLVHPLLTEKSTALGSYNQYVFSVATSATKKHIHSAIKEIYKITPKKIRIIPVRGKKVRTGKNTTGYLKKWKKAIITVPAGTKIDVYES
jgi:large subunit ribosomal protein L23